MTDNAFSRLAAYLAAEILDDLNDRDYVIEQVAAGTPTIVEQESFRP